MKLETGYLGLEPIPGGSGDVDTLKVVKNWVQSVVQCPCSECENVNNNSAFFSKSCLERDFFLFWRFSVFFQRLGGCKIYIARFVEQICQNSKPNSWCPSLGVISPAVLVEMNQSIA